MWWFNYRTGVIHFIQSSIDAIPNNFGPFKTFTDAKREAIKELTRLIGIVERQSRQQSNKPTNA